MSENTDHPLLTKEEVLAARKEARAKLDAERKKDAKARLIEAETLRLKQEEGLVVGGHMDDMVDVLIDLPEYADRLVLDSVAFLHGRSYRMPRHRGDTIREIMGRMWFYQNELDGKSYKSFYAKNRLANFSEVRGQTIGGAQ